MSENHTCRCEKCYGYRKELEKSVAKCAGMSKKWDYTNPIDVAEDFARGNWTHVNDTSSMHLWSGERCWEISDMVMGLMAQLSRAHALCAVYRGALQQLEIKVDWNADDLDPKQFKEMESIIDSAISHPDDRAKAILEVVQAAKRVLESEVFRSAPFAGYSEAFSDLKEALQKAGA